MTRTVDAIHRLDLTDPLTDHVGRYSTGGAIHLNGNSLSPACDGLDERLRETTARWASDQVRGWFDAGWLDLPRTVGDKIATLLGTGPGRVVVPGESTSTVLFNALVGALRLSGTDTRPELLVEAEAFPTDRYIAASAARLLDRTVVAVPAAGLDAAVAARGPRVAAVLAAPVDFRTGRRRDLAATAAACRRAGAVSVFDLSHAAGVLPVELDDVGADLAVGCGYKYLGGGPGAPAFLFAAADHHADLELPLTGWHGHARPFAMVPEFEPASGIDRGRTGTPQLLSLVALDHALDPLVEVGIDALYTRGVALAATFLEELGRRRPDLAAAVVGPRDPARRGAHLALQLPDAGRTERELATRGVLTDSRPPDLLRVAFAPLQVTHGQVARAAAVLDEVQEPIA